VGGIDFMHDYEKNNYLFLQQEIGLFRPEFSFEDAINSWHKPRNFKYRSLRKDVILPPLAGDIMPRCKWYYEFFPLSETNKFLLDGGFYIRYFDFDLDWQQTEFYRKLFDDFFEQYVIAGENTYGYYIFGDIGVG
jgi:hypothetical protein